MKMPKLGIMIIVSLLMLVAANLYAEVRYVTVIPHVAAGGGWTSYLTITDPHGISSRSVLLSFYDDNGAPLLLKVDQVYQSSCSFILAPKQERTFVLTADSSTRTGQIQIASQSIQDLHASLRFSYSDAMGNIVDAVGVIPPFENPDWSFAIDKQTSSDDMGVAIANPRADINLDVSFDLYQNGVRVPGTSTVHKTIAPFGHAAIFVSQLFPTAFYSGTATVKMSSTQAPFVAMALRADRSQYSSLSVYPSGQTWNVTIEGKNGVETWSYRLIDGGHFYGAGTNPENPDGCFSITGVHTGSINLDYFRLDWIWRESNGSMGVMIYQGTIGREGGVEVINGTRKAISRDGMILESRIFKAIRTS